MRHLKSFSWKSLFTLTVFLFAVAWNAMAQENGEESSELEQTIQKLSEDAGRAYLSPAIIPFGINLNGGWFHKSPPPKLFGLNLEFGLVGMGTFFPEDAQRDFSVQGSFRFNSEQALNLFDTTGLTQPEIDLIVAEIISQDFAVSIYGATIIGGNEPGDYINVELSSTEIDDPNNPDETITIGGTVDLGIGGLGEIFEQIKFLPFAAPQVTVGTVLGTQATIRYLPESISNLPLVNEVTDEIGKFSWFGWGIQHNPGVFFSFPLPVDISLAYFKQTLKVGTLFEADTTAYGVTVSKKLGLGFLNLTPYAGYLRESSKIDIRYAFTVDDQEFDVHLDFPKNKRNRMTVGLSLRLLMFNVNADYNFGDYKSATVGIMIGM